MPRDLTSVEVVLFGVGGMGIEYAKVLNDLEVNFSAVGRSESGAAEFSSQTGVKALPGGIAEWKRRAGNGAQFAIIAVDVEELAGAAVQIMDHGIKNILLEKPAGLNAGEIRQVRDKAASTGSQVYVAYNRRFYSSALKAQEMIAEDGGVKSFHFEFTEWPHTLGDVREEVKKNWFLANSSHVVDMAFFLGGRPREFSSYTAGGCDWHPAATIFSGAGVAENGALFSYQANWQAPGRWSVEMLTPEHRLIFRPLEKLQVQLNESVSVSFVELDDELDIRFKPGLYRQTRSFISRDDHTNLISIDEHYDHVVNIYEKILYPNNRPAQA